jgi:iron complex outermembrane receptor protein
MPEIITYMTTASGCELQESAWQVSLVSRMPVQEKRITEFLPNFGASYIINDELSSYFSYGRNYGLSVLLYTYFISQKQSFYNAGITLRTFEQAGARDCG